MTNFAEDGPQMMAPEVKVDAVVVDHLDSLSTLENNPHGLPFFVCDLNVIEARMNQWRELLPGVVPFYAIKSCPDRRVMETLFELGSCFDCASAGEIDTVLELGVQPENIIYANPTKPAAHIRHALAKGVRMMTFDNADELVKIQKEHPTAQMVLRVLADDSKSVCQFGKKFGVHPSLTKGLLKEAKDLGVDVIGVSFHVGSGCFDPQSFADAVHRARHVIEEGRALGFDMRLLDMGGGFPGLDKVDGAPFADVAAAIRPALALLPPGVRVIGEPGRYFAAPTFTLAVHVTSRRKIETETEGGVFERTFKYYVNDGVYGSFNCILFDHANPKPEILRHNGQLMVNMGIDAPTFASSIWGPTCDSMDLIKPSVEIVELNVGDWLYFPNMGAYTLTASSTFNGFPRPLVYYIPRAC